MIGAIHAFMLIIAIAGQPERAVAVCDTYKKCSDEGQQMAEAYIAQFHAPRNFSYRIIGVIITPEPVT